MHTTKTVMQLHTLLIHRIDEIHL